MTERLYYRDAFLKEFEARVISCEPERAAGTDGPRRWEIVLDRTAFYPTSGGQPHDLGTLGGVAVVEVADAPNIADAPDAEHHTVVHYASAAIAPGLVRGEIDWARRFDHMQQHTGQHLLSAVFIELFQFQTVSFHLGRESSTIDLEAPSVVPRHLDEAERRVNEVIFEDRVVAVRFGTAEELAAAGIRKEVDREGVLRAVEIEGIDRQPCGGTHLARTGQAGLLLIRGIERRRDVWRLEFVCGFRALAAARGDFANLTKAASHLSCGRAEVAQVVEKLIEERRAQHGAAKRLEETLADYQARALLAEAVRGVGGVPRLPGVPRVVSALLPDASPAYLKLLVGRVVAVAAEEGTGSGVVVALASGSSGAVVLARSADGKSDLGALLREALADLGGKGGGSAAFAQGSLASPAKAADFVESMKARLAALE